MKCLIKKGCMMCTHFLKFVSALVLWLYIMKCLCCLFYCIFKLMVCGMVQSLVLNCFVLSSLCVSCLCFADVLLGCCVEENPLIAINLTLPTFVPNFPKWLWWFLNWSVVSLSMSVWCLLPLWWCCVLSLCLLGPLMFLYACVGCALDSLFEGELKCFPNVPM